MDNPSIATDASLPDDPVLLKALIHELLAAHNQLQQRYGQLEHRLDLLLKRLYGPRADRINPDQPSLFDESTSPEPPKDPPAPPESQSDENDQTKKQNSTKKKGHGRKKLPQNLRRETIEIDIPEAQKQAIGGRWIQIGEEISERLDYQPSSLFVLQTIRPKYVVRFDDGRKDELKIADLPPQALPKAKAAPGLIAEAIVAKCVDHLPLYRQEQRYARQGVEISRSTLCGWFKDAAEVLTPLYTLMKEDLLKSPIIHADDTPVPVQDHQSDHCRTGRLWTYVSVQAILYEAVPNREGEWPAKFLQGFTGFLQCDAYSGYHALFAAGATEVACWAHVRRKFVEAQKTAPALAAEAVARIKQLYAVEDEAKKLTAPARAELRQQKAKPLLDSFADWLQRIQSEVLPKSPIREAIGYAINQWKALNVYVTDGNLKIDNNVAERAIKPYAIGRKNWLFFGSDNGGKTLATLSSLTATCLMHQINPWEYLRDVLIRLPLTSAEDLPSLLPYAWKKRELVQVTPESGK